MGIKGFSAWLRTTFPHVFCPIPPAQSGSRLQVLHFDQVYVDLNPFLHLAARQSHGIDDVVKACRKNLKIAVQNLTCPTSMVYVSIDGPAPLAKLPEQRARRQDAAITAAKKETFDAQQITPGCLAMTTIESQVYGLLRDIFFISGKFGASQSADFRAIIDGSGVEGEGEFKIIRKVLHDHVENDALRGRVTRAILACDADLFLQALLSDVPHLYLFDPFAPYNSPNSIFSVDRWRRCLADQVQYIGEENSRKICFDFVLIALMSGSDYAPALRYANYRSLWPSYLEFLQKKHQENCLKRPKLSNDFEKPNSSSSSSFTIISPDKKSFNLQNLKDFFSYYVLESLPETIREPLKVSHDELDSSGKDERILNYLEHLIWNLDALVTCNVADLSISLETDKTAPSLLELSDFNVEKLQEILDERIKKNENTKTLTSKSPGVMALMALDRSTECQEFLAEPLRPLMKELKDPSSDLGKIQNDDSKLVIELTKRIDLIPKDSFSLIEKLATFPRSPIELTKSISSTPDSANFYTMALKSTTHDPLQEVKPIELPWMRPYVYTLNEDESWRCPLHRMLFGKYRNNKI